MNTIQDIVGSLILEMQRVIIKI